MKDIETERLILRDASVDDAEDMFEYAKLEEVTKYLSWKPHLSIKDSEKILDMLSKEAKEKDSYALKAIVLKENDKMIGTIDARIFGDGLKDAEFGYCLNPKYWNKGYMSEALKAFIQALHKEHGVENVFGSFERENIASKRVMQKNEMYYYETVRRVFKNKGEVELIRYKELRLS
ncbi:MAG: GNAT family N-acetyltransferase [Eubacteriales bacterium]|uniref:GNAT family N-acetyltransferase n=1 Tax=Fenollaria sp. TaxID=1965292 RepID=UPI002A754FE7|nr:GNAT family N-acetyltransferase [Fenollaria sp.]MDD7339886.1 GNAT family N-acetyltransferase [Eubacteriales bacterium]MDY3106593.1 GNAT family N-acetyltransferase [Fenollaria sp.]